MKYRDVLQFIGACLSLERYPNRREFLSVYIQEKKVDWEAVVKISSAMLVLPALYSRLVKNSLSALLPEDLNEYLAYLLRANRERNEEVLKQAAELSEVFDKEGIPFLFLKGVAFCRIGLYEDIGERMLGDIDVLVRESDRERAVQVLREQGYRERMAFDPLLHSEYGYYPPMCHEAKVAALDVHRWEEGVQGFEFIGEEDIGSGSHVPGALVLVRHAVYNVQVHDRAWYYGDIHLRAMYDYFLLEEELRDAELGQGISFRKKAKAFDALVAYLFGDVDMGKGRHCPSFYVRRTLYVSNRGNVVARLCRSLLYVMYRMGRVGAMLTRALVNRTQRMVLLRKLKRF